MGLKSKLGKWVDAGLITPAQQEGILAHERGFSAKTWRTGMASTGILSILFGISLFVASNWSVIPASIKLGAHGAINLILAYYVWHWRDNPGRQWPLEGALFMLWGLCLTFIALVGQIFQLGGNAYEAVRLWFWLTTPMILLFAKDRYMPRLWALAFLVYVPYDLLSSLWYISESADIRACLLLLVSSALPLGAWALSQNSTFIKTAPAVAGELRRLAILTALIMASATSVVYYDSYTPAATPFLPAAFAIGLVVLRAYVHTRAQITIEQKNTLDILCMAGIFSTLPFVLAGPFIFAGYGSAALSMLHFILLWGLMAKFWQEQGQARYVSLSIALIAGRLFIGFIEIYGGLLQSAFGFILIGLVMLALAKITRAIQGRLAANQQHERGKTP